MAITCLNNRIGLIGCGAPSTPAGEDTPALPVLLINELPGITLQKINDMTNSDQETYLELWANVTKRAILKFRVFFKQEIAKCFKISDDELIDCLICENKANLDVSLWYLHGTEFMTEIVASDEINRWTTIDIEKAERLRGEFFQEFTAALQDSVAAIDPNKSTCVENKPNVEHKTDPEFHWILP